MVQITHFLSDEASLCMQNNLRIHSKKGICCIGSVPGCPFSVNCTEELLHRSSYTDYWDGHCRYGMRGRPSSLTAGGLASLFHWGGEGGSEMIRWSRLHNAAPMAHFRRAVIPSTPVHCLRPDLSYHQESWKPNNIDRTAIGFPNELMIILWPFYTKDIPEPWQMWLISKDWKSYDK